MQLSMIAAALLILLLQGCQFEEKCKDMAFARLDGTTRIEIKFGSGSSTVNQITDLEHIRRIVDFVKARNSDWYAPWFGVPVPRVNAELFAGEKFVGDFGVGKSFFEAQGCGYFYIRDASPGEVREALNLYGAEYKFK